MALLLCVSMIFGFTGCFGSGSESGSGSSQNNTGSATAETTASGAMGRYVEQEEFLPAEILAVLSMEQLPDGSLRLLGDLGGQGIGPYGVYESSDGGKSWTPVDYPWLDQLYGCPVLAAALTAEGDYLSHMENVLGEMPPDDATADESEAVGEDEIAEETDAAEDGTT
ncbi:MAG: sialidase family protein, partial [Oscillospiraceae bacterium]